MTAAAAPNGALPRREGRPLVIVDEADGPGALVTRTCRQLRGPETYPNPHRRGRRPKDNREDAPHHSMLAPPFPGREPLNAGRRKPALAGRGSL